MLSKELLEELKIILKEEYNLELTYGELVNLANKLVGYFDLLAKLNFKENQHG
ncbi:hypothetical protein HY409_03110 [Candidatus Gottesmanbacteria bacterium]|nr:hypothetical protein [Candidatus Gottesmanbacteria bacterium]